MTRGAWQETDYKRSIRDEERKLQRRSIRDEERKLRRRAMPAQKPGRSVQNYATPDDFITAVKRRFRIKAFAYDLAAEEENAKAAHFFTEEEDALRQDWTQLRGPLWLNPSFGHIDPWAQKCAASTRTTGRTIYFLTPASIGATWFAGRVWRGAPQATVYGLEGRLSFDGKAPYPKDCMLTVFDADTLVRQPDRAAQFDVWDWRGEL